MANHSAQPSEQQIQPMLETHRSTWKWFTQLIVYTCVGIAVLLVLMAVFLTGHKPA